ncbi:MAG TPA: farnesyl diphosphate synthase [Pyrinomonadaceae bacterium]|nr:farnesyl diphosphate synthase [Pyrinomonadaceae bacterium]
MLDLREFLTFTRSAVDEALDRILPSANLSPTKLHEAIHWSLFAGGKRIRPALVIATGRTFGAVDEKLLRTAAAIELIHTYSLVHDDLPSMDDDDLRRGRETCHKKFGEATAILAGDVMQTLAFKTIADDDSLDSDLRARLISLIADAAGTPNGMVSGQQLDLSAEGRAISIDELENIHCQKTGALIVASATSGAIIGEATDDELASVEEFARALGLLFQVTDDLLDVTQPTDALGKTAGKDRAAEKATYPSLCGIEQTKRLADELARTANYSLAGIDRDTTVLRGLVDMVATRTR